MNVDYSRSQVEFTHIVDRHCDISWHLGDVNLTSNLILVYDGEMHIEVDGTCEVVKSGTLVYFPKGVQRKAHTYEDRLMKCFAVCFEMNRYDKESGEWCAQELPLELTTKVNSSFQFSQLEKMFRQMVTAWRNDGRLNGYDLTSTFMQIVKLLISWKEEATYDYTADRNVEKVIGYLRDNIHRQVKMDEIAKLTNVSVSYVSRLFKHKTGKPIIAYANELKVETAKEMLASGVSVTDCAEHLGFKDVYYFSKLFKQYVGMAPSHYSRMHI